MKQILVNKILKTFAENFIKAKSLFKKKHRKHRD